MTLKLRPLTDSEESLALQRSEIACAVGDAWVALGKHVPGFRLMMRTTPWADDLGAALDREELATRPSSFRKVKP
jgi:hypothetical protein